MDEIITKLEAVKNALGTLNIISTPQKPECDSWQHADFGIRDRRADGEVTWKNFI